MASSKADESKSGRPPRRAGRLAIFAHMFRPPPLFEPALEAEFRAESLQRWTTARTAAIALLALVWVSYFGWDYFHGYRNQDFRPALDWIFPLRAAGTFCIAAAALILYLRGTRYGAVMGALSACGCALYLLSLAMIAVAPFPYNYLFYYICLPMILIFLFGLFRLPSRLVYALTLFCLVASFAFLTFTQTVETVAPKDLLEYMSKSLSYYNLAALIYLVSFSAIGCAVAVELERTARAAFTRERALVDRNARMEIAQRETRAKTSALVKAKDELRALAEQQNIAKSKFLADAAHDLRQPMQALTNLLGAARHALGQGDAAKADEVLALAQDASRLTRTSFNAVLDISRLESGFVEAELGDVDLPALVEEAAALCRADAEERGVELRLRWRRDRPIVVRSDRHLLGRVIGNLLANAVKYSDPGSQIGERGGGGRHRPPAEPGAGSTSSTMASASPRAIGRGCSAPSSSSAMTSATARRGSGSASPSSARSSPCSASIGSTCARRAGAGTRFSLELPYGAAAPDPALREVTAVPGAIDISGLYILYVEDDALVRRSALALFETLGLRYEAYGSVAELEAALPGLERIPDLLITDYRLPDGRTAEDVVRLTTAAFEAPLPLLVLTGEMQLPADGAWLGRGKVLRKPVTPGTLTAEIAAACVAGREEA